MIRGLALSTCVTMLVPSDDRATSSAPSTASRCWSPASCPAWPSAKGDGRGHPDRRRRDGGVHGTDPDPEPTIVHADGTPKAVDFKAAWKAIIVVPGLIGLIISTLATSCRCSTPTASNCFPSIWPAVSIGFIVGGALIRAPKTVRAAARLPGDVGDLRGVHHPRLRRPAGDRHLPVHDADQRPPEREPSPARRSAGETRAALTGSRRPSRWRPHRSARSCSGRSPNTG